MNEKIWTIFFYIVLGIYSAIVYNTIYYLVSGDEILVDTGLNIDFITLPLIIINLFYTGITIVVFIIYLIADKKVKIMQDNANLELTIHSNKKKKLCSVIIASRNEENVIQRTVKECLKQTYGIFEIIVVCHNCTDKTFDQAKVDNPRVRVFDFKTKQAGKGIALNFGVEKSKGEYILILDADGILSVDFIVKALPLLKNYAAVQGRYVPSNRNYSLISRLLSLEGDLWSTPFMTARTIIDKRCGLGGTGYIIKKNVLLKVGGFTNHLVDDYELTCKLLKSKYRIVFAPRCINYDEKPPNLDILLRQRARWAKGFINMMKYPILETTYILGILFWITPLIVFIGLSMFLIVGFAMMFNLLFGYFPFQYSSITITQWLMLNIVIGIVQSLVMIKGYGWKGLKQIIYIPILNPFALYVMVTYIRALGIKSWGNTKTLHGFAKPG